MVVFVVVFSVFFYSFCSVCGIIIKTQSKKWYAFTIFPSVLSESHCSSQLSLNMSASPLFFFFCTFLLLLSLCLLCCLGLFFLSCQETFIYQKQGICPEGKISLHVSFIQLIFLIQKDKTSKTTDSFLHFLSSSLIPGQESSKP